jgi:antigen flippase
MSHLGTEPALRGEVDFASSKHSYGQILKSSSILGGTQVLVYLISLLKNKAAAVFLGPSGVGLVGLYAAATSMVAVLAGLGLNASGVREVAGAAASQDPARVARVVLILRRLCWFAGAIGWLLTIALAWPLSVWTFGSPEKGFDIALLGSTVMLGAIAGGQVALLQGMRRIADLAKVNLLCVVVGTIIAIALYAWLGARGIVPALIVAALANTLINWRFSRLVPVAKCSLGWAETFRGAGPLLRLGLALMWNGLLVTAVAFFARAFVVRETGLDASGLYQAAWTISGMFSGFVLSAISADFYPRLTGVSGDNAKLKRLVNEQTEVGLLLALPGILGTLVFAPVLLELLYTSKFIPAADLLPWFLLGVFVQVISWPIGFVLLAQSHSLTFACVETVIQSTQVCLILFFVTAFGLVGAAVAFALTQCIHIGIYFGVVRWKTSFGWTGPVVRLVAVCAGFMLAALLLHFVSSGLTRFAAGVVVVTAAGLFCLSRLLVMVDSSTRIGRILWSVPLARFLAGSKPPH